MTKNVARRDIWENTPCEDLRKAVVCALFTSGLKLAELEDIPQFPVNRRKTDFSSHQVSMSRGAMHHTSFFGLQKCARSCPMTNHWSSHETWTGWCQNTHTQSYHSRQATLDIGSGLYFAHGSQVFVLWGWWGCPCLARKVAQPRVFQHESWQQAGTKEVSGEQQCREAPL